jgi:hypothetical protein
LALSPQNIGLTGASDPEIAPELKRSLFFSLLAGNLGVETGSTTTASATTHSLDRPQRFPGLTRNARIWRGQRRRGCLCKQASGAAAVRSTRILWPRIPVSRKQRPSVAETGSTWMSDQSFIRYRRRNRRRSKVRARIEHVFGAQQTSPGGRIVRTTGIARAKAESACRTLPTKSAGL